jgi:hypothetical protein
MFTYLPKFTAVKLPKVVTKNAKEDVCFVVKLPDLTLNIFAQRVLKNIFVLNVRIFGFVLVQSMYLLVRATTI